MQKQGIFILILCGNTLCIPVNYAFYVSDIKLHNIMLSMPNSISPNFILYGKLHWKPRKVHWHSVVVARWVFSLNSSKKSWILRLKHQIQSQLAETPIAPKMVILTLNFIIYLSAGNLHIPIYYLMIIIKWLVISMR